MITVMDSKSNKKKKNFPPKISEMSREKLLETLRKKNECNNKAQQIVEMLCELDINDNWLLDNLQFINQTHYDDVTVERAILKICGYPLCKNRIEKVLKQQYHISTKYNKVFDITERKNFCSNLCYKASIYLKNQLFTSPLWLRDQEIIPKYHLLNTFKPELEKEIIIFPAKEKIKQIDFEPQNIKICEYGSENTKEGKDIKMPVAVTSKNKNINQNINEFNTFKTINKDKFKLCNKETSELTADLRKLNVCSNAAENIGAQAKEKSKVKLNFLGSEGHGQFMENTFDLESEEIVGNCKGNKSKKIMEVTSSKVNFSSNEALKSSKSITGSNQKFDSSVAKVEASICEWFSLDTVFFLFGDKKIRELFSEKAELIINSLNSKLAIAKSSDKIERLIKLYGVLGTSTFDSDLVKNLKPLPDYSLLQAETKSLEIKVTAFYSGQLGFKPSPIGESKNGKHEHIDTFLPLIDSHAQIALRRKIVLDKLNKIVPELLKIFDIDYHLQMNEVQKLVSTFSLSAHNITFKQMEWTLVGIILIKLLSIKDNYLDVRLKSAENQLFLSLSNFNLQATYLNTLIEKLLDTENIFKKLD